MSVLLVTHSFLAYRQRDVRLFFEQNTHQLDFVAHHASPVLLLAPHPRLKVLNAKKGK